MTTFLSRSELGLQPPRFRSTNIDTRNGGLCVHWGGPAQRIGSHSRCIEIWRGWQRFHIVTRGWADIAYNFGFCNHNYVFAGRGLRVRSAANGTNYGNYTHYAASWIGGQEEYISDGAYTALESIVLVVRQSGSGLSVLPHRHFTGTTCPGPALIEHSRSLHNTNVVPKPKPKPEPKPDPWELFMAELTEKQRNTLTEFANAIDEFNTNPRSFVMQLLTFNRTERGRLRELLDAIDYMDSSPSGQGRALAALWREAGARGWERDIEKFRENKQYTEQDLED